GRTKTVTRGPKPVRALKEISLSPTVVASSPTTEGVIASLRSLDLRGKTIGVQLYSATNSLLSRFLNEAGAVEVPVQPYVYAPASDSERVGELVQQLAGGAVDAIVFAS